MGAVRFALPESGPELTSDARMLRIGISKIRKGCVGLKILVQIGVVLGLYWISECIEAVLPFSFPASVISLLLVLILLALRVLKEEQIREKADFLLGNLGFFFLPVISSLINYVELIWENAAAFITICIVSTVVTYLATAGAVRLTCRLMEKRKEERA